MMMTHTNINIRLYLRRTCLYILGQEISNPLSYVPPFFQIKVTNRTNTHSLISIINNLGFYNHYKFTFNFSSSLSFSFHFSTVFHILSLFLKSHHVHQVNLNNFSSILFHISSISFLFLILIIDSIQFHCFSFFYDFYGLGF
jgi:hypothetical protein